MALTSGRPETEGRTVGIGRRIKETRSDNGAGGSGHLKRHGYRKIYEAHGSAVSEVIFEQIPVHVDVDLGSSRIS